MNTDLVISKIDHLKKNKELGTIPFFDNQRSNCIGTAAFALSFDTLLKSYFEERIKNRNISYSDRNYMNPTDLVILPENKDRPGFSGILPFKLFLEESNFFQKTYSPQEYDLVVFRDSKQKIIKHVGVYFDEKLCFISTI